MGCGSSRPAAADGRAPPPKTKWEALDERIPWQLMNERAKRRRQNLWLKMDRRKANNLTEDDCLEGCKTHLDLYPLCGEENTKMANRAAWNASHLLRTLPDNTVNIDPMEFRIYLQYLREYLELAEMFTDLDTDGVKNGQRYLTIIEFRKAQPRLREWGAKINDPDRTFKEIDKSNTGKVSFQDFCTWAERNDLDREQADRETAQSHDEEARERAERKRLIIILQSRLPQGRTPEDRERRNLLFSKFDTKKNDKLTEEECLEGCKRELELNKLSKEADLVLINRAAFNNAKNMQIETGDNGSDTVDKNEFRFYLLSIRNHYELNTIFRELDSSDDDKITREEFKKALPKLQKYGADVKPEDADRTFDEIDTDHTGKIDYYQFASWANRRDLDIEKADLEADEEYKARKLALYGGTAAVVAQQEAPPAEETKAVDESNDRALAPADDEKAKAEVEARKKLWEELKLRLPLDRTKAEAVKRDRLFNTFDENKNGLLTEAECLRGVCRHLKLDQLTDKVGLINNKAFTAAKDLHPAENDPNNNTVDRYEFRAYLSTLRNAFEINQMFDEVDKSGDRRLTRDEFILMIPRLANWGVRVNDPNKAFDEIDSQGNGSIEFNEFCDFATKYNLDMEREDYKKLLEARAAAEADAQRAEMTEEEKVVAREEASRRRLLWDDLKLRLPRLKNKVQNEQRSELFKQFDTAGTGHLYYEEFEAGARSILKLHEFVEPLAPILTRAFHHAANVNREEGDMGQPAIERIEFRIALVFIYDFLELFIKFEELEFSLDRRISFPMFEQICPTLESWGIPLPDHTAAFEEVDEFGVGTVTFDEFADWAIYRHMQSQNVNVARRRSSSLKGGSDKE